MRPIFSVKPRGLRAFLTLRWRAVFILVIATFFQQQHLFFVHQSSLVAKYSPTTFRSELDELSTRSLRPDDEFSQYQDGLIANHRDWKVLGAGWEGQVYVYEDSVIKTFTPGRSPFRNCAPGTAGERWPTEIAAGLNLGGMYSNATNNWPKSSLEGAGFLPVKAYFKTSTSLSPSITEWHLVTPLVEGGNLNSLAKRLSATPERLQHQKVDARFRTAFEELLSHLERLHNQGYCHDDVKPANIFVLNNSSWILGDLGNLREIDHAYHSSKLWRDNRQIPDCRANDVLRALKSYLQFIRNASHQREHFDVDFLQGKVSWSRLYREAMDLGTGVRAEGLRELSRIVASEPVVDHDPVGSHKVYSRFFMSSPSYNKRTVDRALQTRMGEKIARWWAMTWLFGTPMASSC